MPSKKLKPRFFQWESGTQLMHHSASESGRPMLVLFTLHEKCPNTEVLLARIWTLHTVKVFINNSISYENFSPVSLPFTQILEKEHLNSESGNYPSNRVVWCSPALCNSVIAISLHLAHAIRKTQGATLTIGTLNHRLLLVKPKRKAYVCRPAALKLWQNLQAVVKRFVV